eukprot:5020592-Prymnesium_polylepis.1
MRRHKVHPVVAPRTRVRSAASFAPARVPAVRGTPTDEDGSIDSYASSHVADGAGDDAKSAATLASLQHVSVTSGAPASGGGGSGGATGGAAGGGPSAPYVPLSAAERARQE